MRYASLCAIAKDEESNIVEWAEYHLCLGFEHIYVYDNASSVPLSGVLRAYADRGFVTVIDFPLEAEQQMAAYAACLTEFGKTTEWMAFIDIDEFFVPRSCDDVRDFLDRYRRFGGLGVHWRIFGSDGHRCRPEGGVIKNYTTVVGFDNHIKSVVRPALTAGVSTPHSFLYRQGACCVNEDMIPVLSHHSYHTSKTVQLNHYYYKSFAEFQAKLERGRPVGNGKGKRRRGPEALRNFAEQALSGGCHDDAIIRLYAGMGERLHSLAALELFHRDSALGLEHFAEAIAGSIARGETGSAGTLVKKCLRYYDSPAAWLIAAKFYLFAGAWQHCLDCIAKILTDLDSPFRKDGYHCLAEFYRARGDADTAERLLQSLV